MRMNCPLNWKSRGKVGSLNIENRSVNICAGICDSADLCGMSSCEHFDLSKEATEVFMEAYLKEKTTPVKPKMETPSPDFH